MEIGSGILPGQVLQRDHHDSGAAAITGTSLAKGDVEFQLTGAGSAAAWQVAGKADGTTFRVAVKGVPAGGPYDLKLRVRDGKTVRDRAEVRGIYCGDVWLMGGQSNMQGYGNMADASEPHPMVRAFYMRDEWDMAAEPVHYLAEAMDSFHNGYGDGPGRPSRQQLDMPRGALLKGVSPGVFFGREMYRRTGVPQGLIACAHGGTSMAQWSPALRSQGGASLYGAMMRRFAKLGQPVRGMLWYQGESDTGVDQAKVYTDRMIELVAAVRRDMGIPGLPWLIVQLGCFIARDNASGWNSVREQQRLLPSRIRNLEVAPAVDLPLDDGIHIAGTGQAILGKRLARLAEHRALRVPGTKGSICFKGAKVAMKRPFPKEPTVTLLTLEYGNVAGRLQSAGLPGGFVLLDGNGNVQDAIYKTRLDGPRVLIETSLPVQVVGNLYVSYAHGLYSHCNVTDSDGMSIPAMSRVPVSGIIAPFAIRWEAALLRGRGSIAGVRCKDALAVTDWSPAAIEQGFVVLPRPLNENRDGVFAMRTTIKAAAACEAMLRFGADSPFVLWLNGKEVMRDPRAVNPCIPSEYTRRVALREGDNTVAVAFDSRNGAGWGICLTAEPVLKKDRRDKPLTY